MQKLSLYDYCKENNSEYILREWHPTKNGGLNPANVSFGSGKKVWWKCKKGHEWEAKVANRTKRESNSCPYCRNRKLLVGYNDLATTHPWIAKEWHPTKNGDLKPSDFITGSGVKVWWQCKDGHEWKTSICSRTKQNSTNCPDCFSKRVVKGRNDLATTHPELIKEWHPTKNRDLNPSKVSFGSRTKVWWQCEHGHEWEASIANRTKENPTGCPYCSGRKVLEGTNDLATTHPKIVQQWHPIKNGDLKPTNIAAGNYKVMWWQCEKGHEWYEKTCYRTRKGNESCPYCSGKYVII